MSNPDEIKRELGRRSRRGFLAGGVSLLAAGGGIRWLATSTDFDDGIQSPLRRVFEFNEALWGQKQPGPPVREFPVDAAANPRVNGIIGLFANREFDSDLPPDPLKVHVQGPGGYEATLGAADLANLPRVESTTELKCVEGWSTIVSWSGYRVADLAQKLSLKSTYVGMETPDGAYFVGLDGASALHPQTLLCDTMNGTPLNRLHGGPLRLVIPNKYGVKNLKNIGTIRFTEDRPKDYWAQEGYDWYLGL